MRLLRARFENFRLLRDLELEFSDNPAKKLTVIRAANETGKTTILTALQWALYGDSGLPNKGVNFRLHPINWDAAVSTAVPIVVEIDFEVVRYNPGGGSLRETRRRFRLVRTATEQLNGASSERTASYVRLLELTESGSQPLQHAESIINDELPQELREVFFTDGDRALSFIESDVALTTKRGRVQRAIRALLGLGVIEDAIGHAKKASIEINRQAGKLGANTDLARVAGELLILSDEVAKYEGEFTNAKQQFSAFDEKLAEVRRSIDDALRKGDREKLQRDLEAARKEMARIDGEMSAAAREHSNLFRGEALARDVLAPVLRKATEMLDELRDRGRIPNTTLPILHDRLSAERCICGESLADDGGDGTRRRRQIEDLMERSRRDDEIQDIVTGLYYHSTGADQQREAQPDTCWHAQYTEIIKHRDDLMTRRDENGRHVRALEDQVDALPSTDVQQLRTIEHQYQDQKDRFNALQARIETHLEQALKRRAELEQQRERLLREHKKGARVVADAEVSKDVLAVLEQAYQHITDQELRKVSDLMNRIFLDMIGADPDQESISVIKRAQISEEFDIVVVGPDGRRLDPDRDLNGASRRALTLAFILALTKVSEVEAPNVIDTPLGMMSGYVKRAVLRKAIQESSQLVLFLTHSEIAGCEEIIDQHAGAVYTLTNPTHYPKMLVNAPPLLEPRVLRCACNHRGHCQVCERRQDVEELEATA